MKSKCVKITNNLYLGDMHSVPKDCDIEIACAKELFLENVKNSKDNEQGFFWKKNILYLDFYDYPSSYKEININLIKIFLETIKNNINNKKIYVHCIYGINRSPTLVFLYLMTTNEYKNLNYEAALKKFSSIYPRFSINPGWDKFVERYYPFENFK